MAAYKVIQDIEAEDKLVGPLTFRQFVYACIGALCLYLSFLALTKHAAFLMAIFLPVAAVAGFFAFPWGRDQPTEIWALAKIQFMLKPRRRIWNQSGVRELVTITAPKKVEQNYTNGLSESEVRSRLVALADTIDSRGWVIKTDSKINAYGQMAPIFAEPDSDRLINPSSLPVEVPTVDIQASDDVLDTANNPVARQLDRMMNASAAAHRQQIIDNFRNAPVAAATPAPQAPALVGNPANYWFAGRPVVAGSPAATQPQYATATVQPITIAPQLTSQPPLYAPGTGPIAASPAEPQQPGDITGLDEDALMARLKAQESADQIYASHLHTIQPLGAARQANAQHPLPPPQSQQPAQKPPAPVTPAPDPAILALANNDDLSVATIARQANKELQNTDEVVISLH